MKETSISVVVPVFRNPSGPEKLTEKLVPVLDNLTPDWKILFVDDGSNDKGLTEEALNRASEKDSRAGYIRLKENSGQQTAVYAGLKTIIERTGESDSHFIITMDDDLSHTPCTVPILVEEMLKRKNDIIYAAGYEKPDRGIINRTGGHLRDLFFRKTLKVPDDIKIGSFRIMTRNLAGKITGSCDPPGKKSFGYNYEYPEFNGFIYISALVFRYTQNVSNIEYVPEEKPEHEESSSRKKETNLSRYSTLKRIKLLFNLFLYYTPLSGGVIRLLSTGNETPLFQIAETGGWAAEKKIKLQILGGSFGQLSAIERAKKMGIFTIVSDMNSLAPGCGLADALSEASTFDYMKVSEDAERLGSTAFLATGTDQPVLTAARAASSLGLPYFLDPPTARLVTNKKDMKKMYNRLDIPTSPFAVIGKNTPLEAVSHLSPPLVIKPLDSQGQRGVMKLDTPKLIPEVIENVLSYSRENEVLIEEYYPSEEVTVTGWVENGKYIHLTTTDRITVDNLPSIGVCPAHHYPSKHSAHEDEIISYTERIVSGFGIPKGPIYFQYLIGESGIRINESACRLGGAYEDEFIPWITGVDLLDIMIKMSCNMDYSILEETEIKKHRRNRFVSLQMFFYDRGTLDRQNGMDRILTMPGVLGGRYLLSPGTSVGNRENSTQRAGYFIAAGSSKGEVNRTTIEAFECLKALDKNGNSLLTSGPVLLP